MTDKTSGKIKNLPKKRAPKATIKGNAEKCAKYDSPSDLNSTDDDTPNSEEEEGLSIHLCRKSLSDMFVGDPLATLDNDELTRAFQFISKICKAPDLDSSLFRDYERMIRNLMDKIDELNHENIKLVNENVALVGENTKLKNEHSSCAGMIRRSRAQNNQLLDLYNLSDEAANILDEEIFLEHLNSSLNNYPDRGFENLSLEELRTKYSSLRRSHRQALSNFNNFKQRLHESREKVCVLDKKKNKLIDEKDEISLNGGKALEHFQESLIEVKLARDSSLKEKDILMEERNLVRSRLLIESEAEFNWAARVLNNARNDLGVNVSLQTEHSQVVADIISNYEVQKREYEEKSTNLESRLASKEEELALRSFKYQQMKENWVNLVNNSGNDSAREVEAAVTRIPDNVPIPAIEVSEDEDSEEEENDTDDEQTEAEIEKTEKGAGEIEVDQGEERDGGIEDEQND
ncbi:hypothetical protein C5167_047855 [Papaver somniferum]|uniref:Uncharacterized protein n=1 Tax=Papaver somniferum TaxID=3469 RepID=A0A4Y7LLJ8_PAPSO|nr:hypothetical protein C5167_047855 [Papaver somniferum]